MKFSVLRDDGAIIYINGQKVVCSNLPQGETNSVTLASHSITGGNENTYNIYNVLAKNLVEGENIIAVEIHQDAPNGPDIAFDMELTCVRKISLISSSVDYKITPTKTNNLYYILEGEPSEINKTQVEKENKACKVYPNPSTGIINIDLPSGYDHFTISFYNILGSEIAKRHIIENQNYISFDLSKINKGVYFIKIQNAQIEEYKKIVLK